MRIVTWIALCCCLLLLALALPWGSDDGIRAGRSRAIEDAVENLGARSYETRTRAYRRLVSLGEDARPALVEALESPDPEVRLRAAQAIRELDRRALSRAELRERQYREIIRIGLDRAGDLKPGGTRFEVLSLDRGLAARAAATVARRYEYDAIRHQRAVALLTDLGRPEGAPYLAGLLSRGYFLPSTLYRATEGLERFAGAEVLESLRAAAGSPDVFARKLSFRVLGSVAGREDFDLVRFGARDSEPSVRAECARALRRIGGGEAVPDLMLLAADEAPKVRAAALGELSRLPDAPAREAALTALDDQSPKVRSAALAVLSVRGRPEDVPEIRALLADPSPYVRGEAVNALAALGQPALAAGAGGGDPAPSVRRAALYAARLMPKEERRRLVEGLPEESDPFLRDLRRSILGRPGTD